MTRREEIEKKAKDIAKANRLAYSEIAVEQGFVCGAQWADKTMLDKACEWLQEHSGDYLFYPFCEFDKGELVKDFKKAMEE